MNNATQNKTSAYRYYTTLFVVIAMLGLTMIGPSVAIAFYGNQEANDEVSLLEIYREKKYKGALDEEDLKVLVLLPKANSSANRSEDKALEEADEGF